MYRSMRFGLLGVMAVTMTAIESSPVESRPAPAPSFRPPAASNRPEFDVAYMQPKGGGPRGGAPSGGKGAPSTGGGGPKASPTGGGRNVPAVGGGGPRTPSVGGVATPALSVAQKGGGGKGGGGGGIGGQKGGGGIGGPKGGGGIGGGKSGIGGIGGPKGGIGGGIVIRPGGGIGIGIGIGGPVGRRPVIVNPFPRYPYSIYPSIQPYPLVEPVEVLPVPATETGLRIAELFDGAAKDAALREGDIIIGVGRVRVRTFDELVLSLANVTGSVEITYIAGGNGKTEKALVTPVDGKIGVGVVPVDLR